jgi:hypothetical protein
MRQSEGNKTAKRLSAIWRVQTRPTQARLAWTSPIRIPLAPEAIEGLATAALAWLARVLSPLLLKTASVWPAENPSWAGDCPITCLNSSIAAAGSARQRYDRVEARRSAPSCSVPGAAPSPGRTPNDSPAGSIPRSAPAAKEKSAEANVRRMSGAASGIQSRCRNRRSGIQGISGTISGQGSSLPRYTSESRNYEGTKH